MMIPKREQQVKPAAILFQGWNVNWPERLSWHPGEKENEMGVMWLIVGGAIGWLASLIMRTDAQQGVILNIVVSIVGAFIAGLVFAHGNINNAPLTLGTFGVSLIGAIILLAVVHLVRRGQVR